MKGDIYFCGNLLTEEKKREERGKNIALIPQSVSYLNPLIKIGSQIRKGDNSIKAKERCLEILKKYKLDEKVANMYPFQLSGGMIRRVLISTAVYSSPKLILADEPTPGLDSRTLNHVAEHFQELAREGMGILIITHDLDMALKIANRIVVFYDGITIEDLSTDDFSSIDNLNHPYTKALFHAMPQNGFQSGSQDPRYEIGISHHILQFYMVWLSLFALQAICKPPDRPGARSISKRCAPFCYGFWVERHV